MLSGELEDLIRQIQSSKAEGQNLEVKAAREGCPSRLYDTLSAFSNQDGGGVLVFGLDESAGFGVVGVYDPQDLQHKVAEQCKQMEPVVRAVFTVAVVDGKSVVSAEIPGADPAVRPVFYRGAGRLKGAFVRVGGADEPMTEAEIYAFEAFRRRLRDDMRPVEGAGVGVFDKTLVCAYLDAVRRDRPNLAASVADSDVLDRMGMTADGVPTLAGILMFCRYPQTWFPQSCITAVVVPGACMGATGPGGERFIDNRRFTGPIPDMVRDACDFIARNTKVATTIDEHGRRTDKPEYPPRAVREAVLNAVVHRDYGPYSETVPVRVEIYSDRLEIVNCGGLFGRTEIGDNGAVRPDTRNAVLANAMEILHETENRYSGIPTILRDCRDNGMPPPRFTSRHGEFKVTFFSEAGSSAIRFSKKTAKESILAFCRTPRSRDEIVAFAGMSRFYVMSRFVEPMVADGTLEMSIPEKPRSRDQRFTARAV